MPDPHCQNRAAADVGARATQSVLRSPWQTRPVLATSLGIALSVALVVFIAMAGARRAGPGPAAGALELLSMHHTRAGDTLVVSGTVRNRDASAREGLTVVVSTFGPGGEPLAQAQAPLAHLPRGAERSFHVSVPQAGSVARYRLSFQARSGVVRHVDRRAHGLRATGRKSLPLTAAAG